MIWRPLRPSELLQCLDIAPEHMGSEIVGRAKAIEAWQSLLESPAFNATVVQDGYDANNSPIVGFGSSIFVSHGFAESEIADPRPGLNARIIASIVAQKSVTLNWDSLAKANAAGGLASVWLYGCWRRDLAEHVKVVEIGALLAAAFLDNHAGYRHRCMLHEAVGAEEIAFGRSDRSQRSIGTFTERVDVQGAGLVERERELMITTAAEADAVGGSVLNMLFQYNRPMLQLTAAQQGLLRAALAGATDDEIGTSIGANSAVVKKRWRSIYESISANLPELLPDVERNGETRGKQKRHRVLAYVRANPQELRPIIF